MPTLYAHVFGRMAKVDEVIGYRWEYGPITEEWYYVADVKVAGANVTSLWVGDLTSGM